MEKVPIAETRNTRFKDIFDVDALEQVQVNVIGVGAIGRQVTVTLATMGARNIRMWDPDTVQKVNLGTQGFLHGDLGKPKGEAVAGFLSKVNPQCKPSCINRKFEVEDVKAYEMDDTVIFCCVDSISDRQKIWNTLKSHVVLFVDARMAAEMCQILCIRPGDPKHPAVYENSLFPQNQAYEGSCTAKSTYHCAAIAASLMVFQYTMFLRRSEWMPDYTFNILGSEITFAEPPLVTGTVVEEDIPATLSAQGVTP